jgi:hypothetical protein
VTAGHRAGPRRTILRAQAYGFAAIPWSEDVEALNLIAATQDLATEGLAVNALDVLAREVASGLQVVAVAVYPHPEDM